MAVPAQIISTGRRTAFRLVSWNPHDVQLGQT